MLFVSHHMRFVDRMCSRIMLLDGWRIKRESDDAAALVEKYHRNGPSSQDISRKKMPRVSHGSVEIGTTRA